MKAIEGAPVRPELKRYATYLKLGYAFGWTPSEIDAMPFDLPEILEFVMNVKEKKDEMRRTMGRRLE